MTLAFGWLTGGLRVWLDRRARESRDRKLLVLAREHVERFEAANDSGSVQYWTDVIDDIKHQR